MTTRAWFHPVLKIFLLSVALLAGCSNDDNENEGALVTGNVRSVIHSSVQEANKNFTVTDLENPNAGAVVTGTSDANGNYSYRIKDVFYMIVSFTVDGEPSPSGLVSVAEGDSTGKNLNDVTSIACAAGVGAITSPRAQNPVTAAEMDRTRIANLELGAAQAIEELDPYNTNKVSEAVARTRELTDDGDHAP